MATDGADGRGRTPRALIVTVYGLYARENGGWLSVASVVRMLGRCGVEEPAVRSSIYRLKRRGLLEAERVAGVAGYALSRAAIDILDTGDERIFARRRATGDDGWLLAVFSVPETERDKRHQLRSQLAWLGFGTVAAGVWIAPNHLLAETTANLRRHDLERYVQLFTGLRRLGFTATADQVRDWWDLDRLGGLYDAFLTRHQPVAAVYRRRRRIEPATAFADYVAALTDWRRLPYSDPGLPPALLPARWPGLRAADTFFELRERLADPAHAFAVGAQSTA